MQTLSQPLLRFRRGATSAALLAGSVTAFALSIGSAAAQSPNPTEPSAVSPWSAEEPWRTDRFYLETSLYTVHFHPDPAHVNNQKLILGEWNITQQWLVGASQFDNSFGQPSQYVY